MATGDRPESLPDPAAASIGTPAETNRAREGKTQAQYLDEGPGDTALTGMRAAGLLGRHRRRRLATLVVALAAVLAAALAILWPG